MNDPSVTITVAESIHGPDFGHWIDIQLDELTIRQQHTPCTRERAEELAAWLRVKLAPSTPTPPPTEPQA